MHFGENQLSRSLIGLSPLPTGHPPAFQRWWVRSSTRSYPRFNLPMGRSLRFGSRARDSFALFGLAFATASPLRVNLATTPNTQRLPAITRTRFSLFRFRSPLLTESRLLSLPAGNEMFHFPAFPPLALCVQARVTGHDSSRVSPFGHPRISALLAAPRGLSQPPTSFIGSWCQGIHRAPLLTWPQRCSRPLCNSQTTNDTNPHPPHDPNHPDPHHNRETRARPRSVWQASRPVLSR